MLVAGSQIILPEATRHRAKAGKHAHRGYAVRSSPLVAASASATASSSVSAGPRLPGRLERRVAERCAAGGADLLCDAKREKDTTLDFQQCSATDTTEAPDEACGIEDAKLVTKRD